MVLEFPKSSIPRELSPFELHGSSLQSSILRTHLWPDLELAFCEKFYTRVFVENKQWQLFTITATWGGATSWG